MAINSRYVKFIRGTPTAYANLQTKDNDTLYFISETDGTYGTLYLGAKIIAGGSQSEQITLDMLKDITISAGVTDGSLLVYDAASKTWVNKPATEIVDELNISGDNKSIELSQGVLNLKDFGKKYYDADLQPVEGFIAGLEPKVVSENGELVLGWFAPVSTGDLQDQVSALEKDVSSLEELVGKPAEEGVAASGLFAVVGNMYSKTETDNAIAAAIANVDHLSKIIVDGDKDDINVNAENADKFIYLVKVPEKDYYEEYMVVNGVLELLGSTDVDLSELTQLSTAVGNLETKVTTLEGNLENYVLTTTFNSTVGSLDALNTNTQTSIVEAINELDTRLTWEELN